MKKNLIVKYVAQKLAKTSEAAAEMKRVFGNETYLEIIRTNLISDLPPEFRAEIESMLKKRFGIKPHKCAFMAPTVEQWIADLTGLFSEEDVYNVFAQSSGLAPEKFHNAKYGDNLIDRFFLEDIVEMLEASTGRRLTDVGYLTYNDGYTYAQIAKFFTTV